MRRCRKRTSRFSDTASLKAALAADEWLTTDKPVDLKITAQSLDGDGRIAEGVVKIHKLKQPAEVMRAKLGDNDRRWWRPQPVDKEPKPDPANPDSWELGEVAVERAFTTDGEGKATLNFPLEAGPYRAMLETKDAAGKKVTARLRLDVLKLDNKPLAIRIPNLVGAPKWSVEPGAEFMALWGTGYEKARAFIEVEHRGKMVQAFWTEQGLSQQQVKQAVTEAHRGGFTLHVTMVRENRAYLTSRKVEVPWSNKELTVKWEHFTSKLEPAAKETWTAVVSGPDAKKAVAEMVAALYDQSLDAYLPHRWQQAFNVFRQDYSRLQMQFQNEMAEFGRLRGEWSFDWKKLKANFRRLPESIVGELGMRIGWGDQGMYFEDGNPFEFSQPQIPQTFGGLPGGGSGRPYRAFARRTVELSDGMPAPAMAPASAAPMEGATAALALADAAPAKNGAANGAPHGGEDAPAPAIDLSKVSARKNLQETAFFFPQLLAREDGSVAMQFTMPEALTTWRFIGFAHDRELRSGYLEDKLVTAKDVMVQPNPPRFLREGDELEFTVKVSNQSATRQSGKVRLTLADARTGKAVDAQFANAATDLAFDLPSKESRSFSWKLKVPDGAEPLSYKAVGSTERTSDGEEGLLPVLSRRTLVSESLPLPIRGAQTKTFDFTRLLESGKSDTLKSQSLTVQMVSNPSWYAVMALPYLMEFPHECSEQTFNRLYANALARHIAMSDPKIRAVFEQWKGTAALDSPLEKNGDIKSVLLEETPWVRDAAKEGESRRNVGVLFDDNRLAAEIATAMRKLADKQLANGLWPWFPGGRGDDYITLYITTGFGRLRHLGVKVDAAPAVKALAALDAWMDGEYREILKQEARKAGTKDANHLTSTMALYLYGRSFFIGERPVKQREALDYFLGQSRKHWLALPRQSQGHAALALKRFVSAENKSAAEGIVKSLRERAVNEEEMGMFWRDAERSWWWHAAPIETQALMIEVFDEVAGDAKAVEDAKVWLIKSKQTQNWKTTKATADAVYALLLRGANVLASDALVEVSLGGTAVKPEKVEAGTGFYEEKFVRGEVKPELGKIAVKKTDAGVSWGSVHWQYLEDMAKVTAYEGTPLKVTKALFTREHTPKGPVLQAVKGKVKVGDELVVRITLHTDRDMEYVHLKDHRGSGTEPVNVLSGYRWQDGLGYYETTRDTAGHWFFDHLPKGDYVFEATTRVQHRGRYQTGFASLECMYAPEFGGHSESLWVEAE
jgi:Bacterial Alpha-2-macroglobulin MG10 domain/Alpha-2-macroglobulin family